MGSNWNARVSAKFATQLGRDIYSGGKRDAWSGVEEELAHGKLRDTEGTNAQLPCKLWLLVRGSYQTHLRPLNSFSPWSLSLKAHCFLQSLLIRHRNNVHFPLLRDELYSYTFMFFYVGLFERGRRKNQYRCR